MNTIPNGCSSPNKVECRAKLYPDLLLSQLGQEVTCNTEDGLVCLNKNQPITQQCFDYEIRVYCCQGLCDTTTLPTSPTLSTSPTSLTLPTFAVVTGSTEGPNTAPHTCVCVVNGSEFELGNVGIITSINIFCIVFFL